VPRNFPGFRRSGEVDPLAPLTFPRLASLDPEDAKRALCFAAMIAQLTGYTSERDAAVEIVTDLILLGRRRIWTSPS
jgi:hypothetical protein